MAKQWFVIHTQTGWEDKVKLSLEKRVKMGSKEDMISQILIPTEKVSEIREGKKKISQRKFFPGYILLEMELNDDTWYLVKNTPGVSGFIGPRARPVPLQEDEIKSILRHTEEAQEKPMPKTIFEKGEGVRVIDGPFVNFNGNIEEIYPFKGKLKVIISIFGRSTPVELEYWQVEKV
ncbi:MAG: transcription termination/antitermination protein NusG [Candidatus Omnitrophota bacterium]